MNRDLPAGIVGWLDGRSLLGAPGPHGARDRTASIRAGPAHRAEFWRWQPLALRPQDEDKGALNFEMLSGTAAPARTTSGKMPSTRASKGGGQPDQSGLITGLSPLLI